MEDGRALAALKALVRGVWALETALRAPLRRRRARWRLAGDCNGCGACCVAPTIAVSRLVWRWPTPRRLFLAWQRRVNGFVPTGRLREARAFVFRCTHYDPATRRCDSYRSRPWMCRHYPRGLLAQPWPELFDDCSHTVVDREGAGLAAELDAQVADPELRARLKQALRVGAEVPSGAPGAMAAAHPRRGQDSMGRKRKGKGKGFQWVREDVEGEARTPVERVAHRTIQAEDDELMAFVHELMELPGDRRRRLPVDAGVVAALDELQRLEGTARARMIRRVKKLLRGHDVAAVREALAGESPEEARARVLERWRSRVLDEGDPAINAFVDTFETADRQAIRSLARAAAADTPAGRAAARKLFVALKEAVPLGVGMPAPDAGADDATGPDALPEMPAS